MDDFSDIDINDLVQGNIDLETLLLELRNEPVSAEEFVPYLVPNTFIMNLYFGQKLFVCSLCYAAYFTPDRISAHHRDHQCHVTVPSVPYVSSGTKVRCETKPVPRS